MKPSVLLVGNFLSLMGGNHSVAEELAGRLQHLGYAVTTASHMSSRSLRLLDMIFTAWIRRKEYQLAYVAVFSGPAFLWAEGVCLVLNLMKKSYILTLHGGNLPLFACHRKKRVEHLLLGADIVTAPSRYLQEEMRLYRSDIRLLPNPIELNLYPFRLRTEPEPRLVWLRAFHNIYNPQMAPVVVAELGDTYPEITLVMVGSEKGDGALQSTQNQIKELGLQQSIEIKGGIPKSQVPEILEKGDIFINTTNIDNTPISVIEAMACGLCIVSTNIGGIPYLLEDGEDALLVPPNDPKAMATAIRRIMTESGLAKRLSYNARKKAETFDWSIVLPMWEKLFFEIVTRGKDTDP